MLELGSVSMLYIPRMFSEQGFHDPIRGAGTIRERRQRHTFHLTRWCYFFLALIKHISTFFTTKLKKMTYLLFSNSSVYLLSIHYPCCKPFLSHLFIAHLYVKLWPRSNIRYISILLNLIEKTTINRRKNNPDSAHFSFPQDIPVAYISFLLWFHVPLSGKHKQACSAHICEERIK